MGVYKRGANQKTAKKKATGNENMKSATMRLVDVLFFYIKTECFYISFFSHC